MDSKKKKDSPEKTDGLSIKGDVNVNDGDFVFGNKVNVGAGGMHVGGNIENSNVVIGNNNQVSINAARHDLFQEVFRKIEDRPDTPVDDKEDLKANVEDIQAEAAKGENADETFLARRLRNIKRIAPDILEVVTATLLSPGAGFVLLVKKIAEKARSEAGDAELKA